MMGLGPTAVLLEKLATGSNEVPGALSWFPTAGQQSLRLVPESVLAKDQKIDRLLNFLVQTDKIWNREKNESPLRMVCVRRSVILVR